MASYSPNGTVSVRPHVIVTREAAERSTDGWTGRQLLVLAICFILNMLDGMDVLILSYVAPALSADWQISPERLGVVFSAGLAGMAVGGMVIAPMADRFGRRRLILASLIMMAIAMFMAGIAGSVIELIVSRFVVGIGIGTVLASMAALTAEYAPPRYRNFAVGFLQAGYPVGATITGFIVADRVATHGWQAMLLGAAFLCAISIPLVWMLLPESIEFLISRQPKGALEKANGLLRATGQRPLDALPPRVSEAHQNPGVRSLFTQGRAFSTILLWMATIFGFMTLYFVISWIPKLAVEAGLPATEGIYAGAVYNIGAFVGVTAIGMAAMRFDLRHLILAYMLCAAVALVLFGSVSMPLFATLATAFLIGVFVQGGFNGCYPLAANLYPAEARGTGIGWAMGVGRIGAVVGPMLGGVLLAAKVSLPIIFATFAVPVVLAGLCASLIRLPKAD